MSASIITFANLGKKRNLKTTDIMPVIDVFARENELEQIICQIHKDFYFPRTDSAIPSSLRIAMRALEKMSIASFSRRTIERLFDSFSQRKVLPVDILILHGGYFLPKTTRKARASGSIVVDITVSANTAANAQIEKEELARLGYPKYEGWYTLFDREKSIEPPDYVIAFSDFVKKTYLERGFPDDHIFIAQPDIDLVKFTPKAKEGRDTFKVVYVAYTTALKGLHYLLEAWQELNAPGAELVIVGSYSDMPDELIRRYDTIIKSDPSITWVGDSRSPETYYRDASAFVFPSLTEGFSRSTAEAMACGLPIITTENARSIVEDGKTGFVVPIRDAKDIKEKIEFLYNNRDVAEKMGKEARKAIENKKPFGEAVFEIYQEILKRERRPEFDTNARI